LGRIDERVDDRFHGSRAESEVEQEVTNPGAGRSPSQGVDEEAYALVARSRDTELVGHETEAPMRLSDRTLTVVEPAERCDEPRVDPGCR
jgi:hypothetical protein